MYIISTFEHSNYLELAITSIQMKGIKKKIFFVFRWIREVKTHNFLTPFIPPMV